MRFDLRASPPQRAARLLEDGCAVVFTANPALSGTYALDDTTMAEIGSVARDVASGLGLPFGQDTFTYPDKSGAPKTFTATEFQALYRALRDYLAWMTYYKAGQNPALPPQPVTIG